MFGFGKQTFLGVDFGTSSIKVVELCVKNNKPSLVNYGEVDLTVLERSGESSQGNYDATLTVYLRLLLDRMGVNTKDVYVAMPAFIGLVTLVDFPVMSERELQDAIQFEAHKYIPSPLEEVALSWEVVGERASDPDPATGRASKKLEVLLVAALHKEVERYESYIQSVNCEIKLLELETFSLIRATVNGDAGVYVVIDIGSRSTNIVLIENGLVKVSRNIDVGGRDITRTLAENLSIALGRAEVLKKSGKDFLNTPEGRLIFSGLESIGAETLRVIKNYLLRNPGKKIDGIILSGGTASFVGIAQYYEAMMNLPVSIANPWRQIDFDPRLASALDRMGSAFSVAIGLALQGVGSVLKGKAKK